VGTSKSYGGPGDNTPLLPDWAQGNGAPPPREPPIPPPPLAPPSADGESPLPAAPGLPTGPISVPSPIPQLRPWRVAKLAMGRFASSGGRESLQKASRSYVRARGGAASAGTAATAGRAATTRVVGFLSDVARRGIGDALRAIGLGDLLGQPIEVVLAGIVNALAPEGANFDDVAARRTIDEALVAVFERYGVVDGGIERLNTMDADGVQEAFHISVAEFVFQRWMLDLGQRIDDNVMTAREARKLELEVKAYVTEAVKLDLRGKNVLTTDWRARGNQEIVENIYKEAYRFLEV